MRILVTGGAGYLGSVVTMVASAAGHQVRVIDNLLHGAGALSSLLPLEGFEFLRGDIRCREDIAAAVQDIDAIVHLAAIVGDPACSQQREVACTTNHQASLELIRHAEDAGVRHFLFASTCSNYGRMQDTSVPATEDHELCPLSLYAETKVAVERELLAPTDGRMIRTVLRFATLFGVSPRMRFDLTVNEFVMRAMTEGILAVYGDQFWRPYVHVRDAARAILHVLETPSDMVHGEVFNVGDCEENYRKSDLITLMREALPDFRVEYVRQADDPRDYRVSFERIRARIGFHVTRRMPAGIREIAWALSCGALSPVNDPRKYNTASV